MHLHVLWTVHTLCVRYKEYSGAALDGRISVLLRAESFFLLLAKHRRPRGDSWPSSSLLDAVVELLLMMTYYIGLFGSIKM